MSTRVVFSRLAKNPALESYAQERIGSVVEKFRGLAVEGATVRLSMLNSPSQPGPDRFTCEVRLHRRRGLPLLLREASANLHGAIAEAADRLLERLSRAKERRNDRKRRAPRRPHMVALHLDEVA